MYYLIAFVVSILTCGLLTVLLTSIDNINFKEAIGLSGSITGLLAITFSVASWFNERRLGRQKVSIILRRGTDKILPIKPLRKDFSRAELQGLISLFTKDPTYRYKFEHMSKQCFFDDLAKVKNGKSTKLVLELTDEEFDKIKDND